MIVPIYFSFEREAMRDFGKLSTQHRSLFFEAISLDVRSHRQSQMDTGLSSKPLRSIAQFSLPHGDFLALFCGLRMAKHSSYGFTNFYRHVTTVVRRKSNVISALWMLPVILHASDVSEKVNPARSLQRSGREQTTFGRMKQMLFIPDLL